MSPDAQAIVEALHALAATINGNFAALAIVMIGCTIALCWNLRRR